MTMREVTSVVDAVNWANDLPYAVTLYLYDEGQGINIVKTTISSARMKSRSKA